MGCSRRAVLAAAGGAALGGAPASRAMFLSAATDASGNHFAVGFDDAGLERFRSPLPTRGHFAAVAPRGDIAFVAPRRPGTRATLIGLICGRQLATCDAAPGHHFYGHATYAADGQHLFTTENDYRRGGGVVCVRRADSLAVVAEFDSGGVGPHELAWCADGRKLAVANGGIRTHPRQPRRKLNLDRMRPNLTIIDAASGRIIDRAEPTHRRASVRHLAAAGDGMVVCMQHEGPSTDEVPLVALYRGNGVLQPLKVPLGVQRRMRQYTAGVALDPATGRALVTCPRGNLVTFWDVRAGACMGAQRLNDCAGIALDARAGEFVVTTGHGLIVRFSAADLALRRERLAHARGLRWDNHLAAARAV